jgi:hypothetical protein
MLYARAMSSNKFRESDGTVTSFLRSEQTSPESRVPDNPSSVIARRNTTAFRPLPYPALPAETRVPQPSRAFCERVGF